MRRETARVLIDLASAAERPSEEALRSWAADQRAFISSVMAGLEEERRAAAGAIEAIGAEPVWFENFGGRDDDPEQAYLSEVRSSDIYVGILGPRYGRLLRSRRSATNEEYREAENAGMRVSVWTSRDEAREADQQTFVNEVQQFHTTGRFGSPQELADGVRRAITRIAAEEMSPWCKLGHVIFRAREVRDSGDRISVEAIVKDREVAKALEGMRGDLVGGFIGGLTYGDHSSVVRIKSVETTARASRAESILLTAVHQPDRRGVLDYTSYSSGGRRFSPEDLTEIALRTSLFGEQNPLGYGEFMSSMDDPLALIRHLALPEEVLKAVTRLLLTEALVGEGRASRIVHCRLGPDIGGSRRLDLAWQPTARLREAPPVRRIEGLVRVGAGRG